MTPEEIAALGDMAREIMRPLQEWLIEDICRRIAKAGTFTSTAEFQRYRARALGVSDGAIKTALKRQGALTDKAIAELFGYLADATAAFEDNGALRQLVKGYIEVAQKNAGRMFGSLGIVAPTGEVVPIGEAYRETMDFAFKQVFTGAADYTTALRKATGGLAGQGVRYINNGGPKSRTVSIEYATRQTLMTRMGELNQEITQMNHDAIGCDGWEISAHSGCAPDHVPAQGRQYTDAEYSRLNKNLARPIGTLSCGHYAMPVKLGVNSPQWSEAQLARLERENRQGLDYQGRHYTRYEASQERSGLESDIRKVKTHILADRSLGDADKLRQHEIHLVQLQREYKRFCGASGQPTQSERLQVAGFGHSESTLAQAAARRLTS
jgi:hypothetical protein